VSATIRDAARLLERLRAIHGRMRDAVVAACEEAEVEHVAAVVGDDAGDTVFAIDRVSEAALLEHFGDLSREWPMLLVEEGLGASGRRVMPNGATPEIVMLVDPIDGTRGLMYQKRPAWILTGVAPYRGGDARLADVEVALQTEIPLVKQHLSDCLWTVDGRSASGERFNRITGRRTPMLPRPSVAATIEQGFGNISRFFPGSRGVLAEIDDELVERVLGPAPPGRAQAFEDQYICTGGQLYEMMMGHDRWTADLRPLVMGRPGATTLGCHPYDLATESIARAAGVIVTAGDGRPLDAPLDTETDVAWIGYANTRIRDQVEPVLSALLRERGLLP
jgi:fructose-1,6-bisphosphatase/inositol monophosphatase family enzyme